ncbi:MAG: chemotaxis protein CheV [Sedimentisphaerales bacterium]|nr:chemotaxis protein CheV [Sedimentisphaerales bacterium]
MAPHNILLEAGTNEMELLTFKLGKIPFGVNVAKVREIVQCTSMINVPHAPYAVEGSFRLRDKVLTLINLGKYFGVETENIAKGEGLVIVVEFNSVYCGILVDSVDVITRMSWSRIEPPSPYLVSMNAPITGTVKLKDQTVLVIDFETVVGAILGVASPELPANETVKDITKFSEARILFADDSGIVRDSMRDFLAVCGYHNVIIFNDGLKAWEYIDKNRYNDNGPCDMVVSDIEMPCMDGLHLARKIKEDPQLKDIPVILLSSLITPDNINKGKAVGVNAQIRKSETEKLVDILEESLANKLGAMTSV